jgi:hypothetical protein
MWYVYTMEFYSAIKKNKIMSFEDHQVKQNQPDSERQISHFLSYWNLDFFFKYESRWGTTLGRGGRQVGVGREDRRG